MDIWGHHTVAMLVKPITEENKDSKSHAKGEG